MSYEDERNRASQQTSYDLIKNQIISTANITSADATWNKIDQDITTLIASAAANANTTAGETAEIAALPAFKTEQITALIVALQAQL